ncbi:alpha/beta fold hydrolase [Mycobacterium sp. WMMD1722]|uniref:alpha/beta fold hydrolase n=1 Tax=Mycobacterium sp. WMMD1722 TaxID=3404117 RepID=UPI003BF53444
MQATEAHVTLTDFRFSCGQTLAAITQNYRTLGTPRHGADGAITNGVLLLHGTTGSGAQFLMPATAEHLFGPGQPLDLDTYYVIVPDALGHGGSSKPSDGLGSRFPQYGYVDIVAAQHQLVTEHLGIRKLRLVAGTSMGGMQTWMWGQMYPDAMSALMPIAALPQPVRGRNLLYRRLLIEAIRTDPAYQDGDYDSQPRSVGLAVNVVALMSHGVGALESAVDSIATADARIRQESDNAVGHQDANDVIWEFAASFDYDPSGGLGDITAPLLAVNFEDDEVNPNRLGVLQHAIARVARGRAAIVPASPESDGHLSLTDARLWASHVRQILAWTEAGAHPRS